MGLKQLKWRDREWERESKRKGCECKVWIYERSWFMTTALKLKMKRIVIWSQCSDLIAIWTLSVSQRNSQWHGAFITDSIWNFIPLFALFWNEICIWQWTTYAHSNAIVNATSQFSTTFIWKTKINIGPQFCCLMNRITVFKYSKCMQSFKL